MLNSYHLVSLSGTGIICYTDGDKLIWLVQGSVVETVGSRLIEHAQANDSFLPSNPESQEEKNLPPIEC